ncbi:hypothetical protein [Nocardia xishanensis]
MDEKRPVDAAPRSSAMAARTTLRQSKIREHSTATGRSAHHIVDGGSESGIGDSWRRNTETQITARVSGVVTLECSRELVIAATRLGAGEALHMRGDPAIDHRQQVVMITTLYGQVI